jgi:hypothetical protein
MIQTMNDAKKFRLYVSCGWMNRPMTLGEFADLSIGYLKKLRDMHQVLREGMYFMGKSRKTSVPVVDDLSNAEEWIVKRMWSAYDARNYCTALDAKGKPTRESTTNVAFNVDVSNLRREDKDDVKIGISGGGQYVSGGGGAGFDLPVIGPAEIYSYEFCKEVLRLTVEHWKPERGSVSNRALSDLTSSLLAHEKNPYKKLTLFGVPWLQYLDEPEAARDLPLDVQVEPFGPGGIFFALSEQAPIDQTRLDAITPKAQRIRDALLPGQWLVRRSERTQEPLVVVPPVVFE